MYSGFGFRVDLMGLPPSFEISRLRGCDTSVNSVLFWFDGGCDAFTTGLMPVSTTGLMPASSAPSGCLEGRPLFGREASTVSSRIKAGLQSAHALSSLRTSPFAVSPTLISNVLLEGLEMILKGPRKRGSSPLVACCLT